MSLTEVFSAAGPWGPILTGLAFVFFLAGVGLIALVVRWHKIKGLIFGPDGGRHRDDALIRQIVEQNSNCRDCMTKVMTANTEALVKMADVLRENGDKLDRNHREMQDGLTRIHERVDSALSRRAA